MSTVTAYTAKQLQNAAGFTYTVSKTFLAAALGTADKAILLVDVSAGTAAEWAHAAGSAVKLKRIEIDIDIGSFTGELLLGWVKENDGTDGTLYVIQTIDHPLGDRKITLDFESDPFVCDTAHQLLGVSAAETELQDDAAYGLGVNSTLPNPAVGDLVLFYDYAGAAITSLDITCRYGIS